MKLKDWQQIEDLFHAALEVEAAARPAYLEAACEGDESLRVEVESLLGVFERDRGFMERPALSLGLRVLSDGEVGTLAGRTIGPYKIVRLLGRGMSEVYLAEDQRLNRNVALKFFTGRYLDDEWVRRQLTKEAQALARLEHPNICAVYGLERAGGYDFIVMQYVEGETLASLMSRGPLELDVILDLAAQIARALAAAHAEGIIHRDIKPQNVVVTAAGQAKVLDFGLAKIVEQTHGRARAEEEERSQVSQSGLIVGTVPYMSPEQLRAEEVDFRTDIFSVGVLLYELISGRNPHKQASDADTISATLTTRPQPPTHPEAKIPRALEAVVLKCLEKDKAARYQSAGELLAALRVLPRAPARRLRIAPRMAAALVILLLLIVGLSLEYFRSGRVSTLAVLPLINESGNPDAEYLGSGLTQSLVSQLSSFPDLRVYAPSSVPAGDLDAAAVGRNLKAETLLVEKIKRRGELLRLEATLLRAADGAALWQAEYDLSVQGAQALPAEISKNVLLTLRPSAGGALQKLAVGSLTEQPEAYRLYLLGRHYWGKRDEENIKKAISYFTQATEVDPLFAQAWAGLADSYVLLPTVAYGSVPTKDALPKARAAAKRALEIDERLCDAHISMGVVKLRYDWDWPEAEREFKRAIELNPSNSSAHYWYANLLSVTGRFNEAIAESEAAKELDPFSPIVVMNLGRAYYRARDYNRAAAYFKRLLEEDPNNSSASYVLGYVYLQQGLYGQAIEIFEKIASSNKWLAAAPLGYAYAKAERKADALKILAEMEEHSKTSNIPPQERAIIYIGLGDKDLAFSWLEKAYEERFASIIALTSDPMFDSLRSDARFASLARKINLNP
jgi:serine/threonine protein kinase/Flp pilus assembly protein TadD